MSGGSGVPLSDRLNMEKNKLDKSIRDYRILPQFSMVTTNAAGRTAMHKMNGGGHAETNEGELSRIWLTFHALKRIAST
ncbi:unnamed protein product [Cylicocyclus nassatus]|uniref:Uncharacterized protein n=1 Tax=Cylicocyclus nassatus TaxID=53992 RepID=A0AA36DQP7_CYLNA|nr:unnamed protein product [Cylicocyclus nassatus]